MIRSAFLLTAALAACTTESNLGNTQNQGSGSGSGSPTLYMPFATTRWALALGGAGADFANGVAVDATSGDVIAGGAFSGTVDFGDQAATTATSGGWVSRRAASDGHALWTLALPSDGSGSVGVADVAITGSGDIVVVGSFAGDLTIGSDVLHGPSVDAFQSSFVTDLDPTGTPRWNAELDNTLLDHVVAGTDGQIAVSGAFDGSLAFPNGTITSSNPEGVIAAFAPDGTPRWGVSATVATSYYTLNGLVMTPEDDLVVIGGIGPATTLAGRSITPMSPDDTVFIARLTIASDIVWVTTYGTPGLETAFNDLAVAPDGSTVAAGFQGPQIGGPPIWPVAIDLDPTGVVSWTFTQTATDMYTQTALGTVAVVSTGDVVAMGGVGRGLDLGDGRISGCGFTAEFDTIGALSGEQSFTGSDDRCGAEMTSVEAGAAGAFAMAGQVTGSIDLGTGPLRWDGSFDGSNQDDNPDIVIAVFDPR